MSKSESVAYATSDGVDVHAVYWHAADNAFVGDGLVGDGRTGDRFRGDVGCGDIACVVAHGYTGSSAERKVQRICRALADAGFGVLSPDSRGHGRSAGACTAGDLEVLDVQAAVAWLRGRGFARVAVLGWSMGGSVVLRYAGLGGDADAVVAISAPGMWFERGTRAMRLVHWTLEKRLGRLAVRLARGTRIGPGWIEIPPQPIDVAGAIAPTPLLIVHGDADHYFPMRHPDALAAAAPTAEVWIEAGMTHAETGTTPELIGRIADWIRTALRVGTPPSQSRGGRTPQPPSGCPATPSPSGCDDGRRA